MSDKTKIEMYIDWFSNFLTLDRFAEYYDLSEIDAINVINAGRELFQNRDGDNNE